MSNGRGGGALKWLKLLRPLRSVEGPRGRELLRRFLFQAAVWGFCVAVDPPVFDDFSGLVSAG